MSNDQRSIPAVYLYAIFPADLALIHRLVSAIDAPRGVCFVIKLGDAKGHRDVLFSIANRKVHSGNLLTHAFGNKLGARCMCSR